MPQTYEEWLDDIVVVLGDRPYTRREYYHTFVEGSNPKAIYEQHMRAADSLRESGDIVDG